MRDRAPTGLTALAAAVTPVAGLLEGSSRVVYASMAIGLLSSVVLIAFVLRRRSTRTAQAAPFVAHDTATPDDDRAVSPTLRGDPIEERGSLLATATPLCPTTSLSGPWSALEPTVELRGPEPGLLGRLRRPPLVAETRAGRPQLQMLGDQARPATRISNSDRCPTKSKSASRSTNQSAKKKASSSSSSKRVAAPSERSKGRVASNGSAPTSKASKKS